jgi:hypothetical protein
MAALVGRKRLNAGFGEERPLGGQERLKRVGGDQPSTGPLVRSNLVRIRLCWLRPFVVVTIDRPIVLLLEHVEITSLVIFGQMSDLVQQGKPEGVDTIVA